MFHIRVDLLVIPVRLVLVVNVKLSRDSLISIVYESLCFPLSTRLTCLIVNDDLAKEFCTDNLLRRDNFFFLL